MDSYRASRVFILPQNTLQRCVKDRQKSSSEAIKTKLGGSELFLVKQKMICVSTVV